MYHDLLTTLRDERTTMADFRRASDKLARVLCAETLAKLGENNLVVRTPPGSADGLAMPVDDLMLVPALRAGLALLPAFVRAAPRAPVAFVGVARDERTARPDLYYTRFPAVMPPRALIIDPMLATAGTACLVAELLMREGYSADFIHFVGVLAAREGMDRLAGVIPRGNITLAAIDPALDARKFIVPGIGDYGDRYFGA